MNKYARNRAHVYATHCYFVLIQWYQNRYYQSRALETTECGAQ